MYDIFIGKLRCPTEYHPISNGKGAWKILHQFPHLKYNLELSKFQVYHVFFFTSVKKMGEGKMRRNIISNVAIF